MLIMGIDPGKDGGVAVIDRCQFGEEVRAWGLKDRPNEWLMSLILSESPELIVIEGQHPMPSKFRGGIAQWHSGYSFGVLIGLCIGTARPHQSVLSRRWKKAIIPECKGKSRKEQKQIAIDHVKANYPDLSLRRTPKCTTDHDGMAEAVCLAEYGRMMNK